MVKASDQPWVGGTFHLTDVTDPLSHFVHTDYDDKHHPFRTTAYPAPGQSITTRTSYYSNGLINTVTDGRNVVTTLAPDSFGNPLSSKTSTAPAIVYEFDAIGEMKSLTDQENAKTSFSYDKRGLATGSTDPLLKNVVMTYYDDGTLRTVKDRNNKTTTFVNTPTGKIDTATYHGGSQISFTYDLNDFMTKMHDSLGDTIYVPDEVRIPVKAASETGVMAATSPPRKRPVFRPETGQSGETVSGWGCHSVTASGYWSRGDLSVA